MGKDHGDGIVVEISDEKPTITIQEEINIPEPEEVTALEPIEDVSEKSRPPKSKSKTKKPNKKLIQFVTNQPEVVIETEVLAAKPSIEKIVEIKPTEGAVTIDVVQHIQNDEPVEAEPVIQSTTNFETKIDEESARKHHMLACRLINRLICGWIT